MRLEPRPLHPQLGGKSMQLFNVRAIREHVAARHGAPAHSPAPFFQCIHHSLVKGAATNTLHWWSGELTANYLAMQVALDFNTERKAGVAFFIVF